MEERRAVRSGVLDGVHLHMRIQLDRHTDINTLEQDTSWSTTYIRLSDAGVPVQQGDRIVCKCVAIFDSQLPQYSVKLGTGPVGRERLVGEFDWEGCG